ncbi:MAG: hypothetical protein J1F42_02810 [Lachnospiraceae bacterium]|nr:hypothetical protein [Lachnospiraceae bacterium]
MAENTSFTAFPANKFEALAMLYMQNQNLSGFTPEQLLDKFQDAYARIRDHERARGQVTYN